MINPCPFCRHSTEIGNNSRCTSAPSGPMQHISASLFWVVCGAFNCAAQGPRRETPDEAISEWNRITFFQWIIDQENAAHRGIYAPETDPASAYEEIDNAVGIFEMGYGHENSTPAARVVQLACVCAAAQRYAEFLLLTVPPDEVRALVSHGEVGA